MTISTPTQAGGSTCGLKSLADETYTVMSHMDRGPALTWRKKGTAR